ncbi:MAG: recombinase family protein [Selenomonadaceae bacterium]
MNNIYGYVRVSTKEQKTDRQLIALVDAGVDERNIFVDKISGKDFERPSYKKLMDRLESGDTLFVKSIDRLGRSYSDVIEEWQRITKAKHVDIVVLDMPLLDTRRGKDLLGTFISDLVLQLLSFVAENERANIRRRQAEGIEAAKAKGVQFGRPRKPLPEAFDAQYRKWRCGDVTIAEAAKACEMPASSFYAKARERMKNEQGQ